MLNMRKNSRCGRSGFGLFGEDPWCAEVTGGSGLWAFFMTNTVLFRDFWINDKKLLALHLQIGDKDLAFEGKVMQSGVRSHCNGYNLPIR